MADEKAKAPPSPESDTAKESGKQSLADMVKAVKAAQEKQTDFPVQESPTPAKAEEIQKQPEKSAPSDSPVKETEKQKTEKDKETAGGRDIDLNGIGGFVPGSYLCESGEPFIEYYTGREDIPTEYRIAGPSARNEKEETRSILETIKQFREAPPVPHKDKAGFLMRNGRLRVNMARGSADRK